ncbi:MAG: hypothetical protein JWQ27_519 [Ferruginibacter sp.]|nr:hypothetical protein [Ferruginibacter sp.]
MKNFLKQACLPVALALLVTGFSACQKETSLSDENPEGKQRVMVYLNDDPVVDFTKVLVDIRYVEVKVDSSGHGRGRDDDHHDGDHDDDDDNHGHDNYGQWDTIAIAPGVYDLLQLRNGVDTLIGNGFTYAGRITKIRFTLGDSNRVFTDSTHSAPLSICDGRHYVYAKVKSDAIDTLGNGQVRINVDFDVTKSIQRSGGQLCLKPQLKAYCGHNSGELEGKIFPAEARPLIKVYNANDTAYAVPFGNGKYKIKGLAEGIYTMFVDARSPYADTTISNIQVRRGRDTEIPTITLHH